MLQTPKPDPLQSLKATPHSRPIRKSDRVHHNNQVNPQDDCFSVLSAGRFFILHLLCSLFVFFEKRKQPFFYLQTNGVKFHSFLLSKEDVDCCFFKFHFRVLF